MGILGFPPRAWLALAAVALHRPHELDHRELHEIVVVGVVSAEEAVERAIDTGATAIVEREDRGRLPAPHSSDDRIVVERRFRCDDLVRALARDEPQRRRHALPVAAHPLMVRLLGRSQARAAGS